MIESSDETMLWLKWSWRHHALCVDEFVTFGDAVAFAKYAAEDSAEKFDCIEGPNGLVDSAIVDAEWRRLDFNEQVGRNAKQSNTHKVTLRHPKTKETASLSWHLSEHDAAVQAEKLRKIYGDRIRVAKVNNYGI